jgi:branched-chain amino acid transport system ATP-binding protein
MLEVTDVRKSFGGFVAVRGMNLALEQGELRALIGPNGAGKTTLLNLVSGWFAPDSGTVRFQGREIAGLPAHQLYHTGIARSFQVTSVFPGFSVFENVQVALMARRGRCRNLLRPAGAVLRDEVAERLAYVKLAHRGPDQASELNAGDRKRLEFAMALASEPALLLLDEPTAGMGEGEKAIVVDVIRRINREAGVTVLFTEHDMDVVFTMADRITVMHEGRRFAEGAPGEVRDDARVQEIYFGGLDADG